MLSKFKKEREKRKMAPPAAPSGTGSTATTGPPGRSGNDRAGDYRSSRDDYRERDRGYERHSSSKYE